VEGTHGVWLGREVVCRAGLLLARFDVRCWDAGW